MPTFGINQKKEGLEAKFYELCQKLTSENNLELYDLDYLSNNHTLRVFIMNPETKTAVVEDCVLIDRALAPFVEEEEWMPETLTVEVSSPGIFRNLKTTRHFEWSIGERVSITIQGSLSDATIEKLPKSLQGQKKFIGFVETANDENIVLNIEEKNINIPIELDLIKKAQWEPKF